MIEFIRKHGAAALTAAALAAAFGAPMAAQAQNVGVLAAVNRDVTGQRPAEPPRSLLLKDRLILNERVSTNDIGGGQIMFLDQTTLTLTPNSDIVLDRYIYDPDTKTGDLTVSVLKGAMRLVGGRISKTGVATIKTPSATIGIRGGIGNVNVNDDGGTTYIHVAGNSSTITTDLGSLTVTREGGTVEVAPAAPDSGGASGGSADGGGQADGGGSTGGGTTGGAAPSGAPVYVGVADEETVSESFGTSAGSGDGGGEVQVSSESVEGGFEALESEISGSDELIASGPISTSGESQTSDGTVSTTDGGPGADSSVSDDVADRNQAAAVADSIDQIQDGLKFRGTWSAFAGLSDGGFVLTQNNLKFQLDYSLTEQVGRIAVQLPGGVNAPNVQDLDGNALAGDSFVVEGDEGGGLDGAEGLATTLGGDASDTSIRISELDRATGSVTIDYTESSLENVDFVDGDINPVTGTRVVGQPIVDAVNNLR